MDQEPLSTSVELNEQIVYNNLNNHLHLMQVFFDQLTEEQKRSAARVIVHQGYGVKGASLNSFGDDSYLMIQFDHISIGIEKDGYAHS